MNKFYTFLAAILLTTSTFAQAPEKMSYQAVIRNSSDALVANQAVGMRISILQTTASGTAVYVETQTPTTNINGLVSLEIGIGTPVTGTFAAIDWATGPYFIKTETDPTGSTTYTITGTSQLMSVPYALYAKTAESISSGGSASCISKLADAPTTYATIGNYQFRYNSTAVGGYIEVRAISGGENTMVFCTKKTGSWNLGGTSTEINYRHNTSIGDSWAPLMSLWDGSGWNDRVTLSTYESFEATIFSMGNGSTLPSPLNAYKIFAAIDGYDQAFIRVVYNVE